jgi:hypothetical protein
MDELDVNKNEKLDKKAITVYGQLRSKSFIITISEK